MTCSTSAAARREGSMIRHRSRLWRFLSRFARHRVAVVSLVILLAIMMAALNAGGISPYNYDSMNLPAANLGPTMEGRHYFGTDKLGRDYFTRVFYGTRTTIFVAMTVALLSTLIGTIVGAAAGYFGGRIDNLLMRLTDLVIILPGLALLMILTTFLGEGTPMQVAILLSSLLWTLVARIVRAQFLSLRRREFVEAAILAGASPWRVIWRHILPNTLGPIIVNATLTISTAILIESALSFIGFGVKPPTPALGQLISQGRGSMQTQWWLVTFPGLMIVTICLTINFIGDGLRDALDARHARRS
ncbi:ABC transporter permease [Mesorhizobium sp. CN2-181]|uniref:ABC transporter permease n=1 Tax=Mesorhizobium yinganensis TaxID=3157707 RepID=UPI0032B81220